MKYFKVLSILVLIIAGFLRGSSLQAQTGGETPELVVLRDADTGLSDDMTRVAKLYTNLMRAAYFRTGEHNLPKSKALYDALIKEIDDFSGILSAREISFIYTERASLRFPKLQDINGAQEDAKTAIKLNPENVKATWVLAQIVTNRFIYHMERNRNGEIPNVLQKEMFDTLKRVVELDADHDMAHFYRGSMARDLGNIELAITSFKALTRIMPYDDRYHRELAELYEIQNRLDDALQSYERVVTIRPEQKSARNRLGQLYLQTGDYPAAIKTFLHILSPLEDFQDISTPKTSGGHSATNTVRANTNIGEAEIEAHHGISLAYQAQNDFERSEFHITRMITLLEEQAKRTRTGFRTRSSERIKLAKRIQDARYTLGQIYLKFNVPQKAIQTFAKILDDDDEYVLALSGIGMAYQMQDDVKGAERYLRKAIELSTEEELPEAYNALGYLYAEQGINLDEAATLVRRALKSAPRSGAYLDSLGLIYFKQGKLDAAIENLEQALHYLPNTPEILLHLADAYLGKGLKQKALQTLEQAVLLEPNNAELLQRLNAVKSR